MTARTKVQKPASASLAADHAQQVIDVAEEVGVLLAFDHDGTLKGLIVAIELSGDAGLVGGFLAALRRANDRLRNGGL